MNENNETKIKDTYVAELLVATAQKMTKKLKFPVYLGEKLYNSDIEAMDLNSRGTNGLRRSGIKKIGELVDRLDDPDSLKAIRGVGKGTADEIMYKLFLFQYSILPQERKGDYLHKVMELNGMIR